MDLSKELKKDPHERAPVSFEELLRAAAWHGEATAQPLDGMLPDEFLPKKKLMSDSEILSAYEAKAQANPHRLSFFYTTTPMAAYHGKMKSEFDMYAYVDSATLKENYEVAVGISRESDQPKFIATVVRTSPANPGYKSETTVLYSGASLNGANRSAIRSFKDLLSKGYRTPGNKVWFSRTSFLETFDKWISNPLLIL